MKKNTTNQISSLTNAVGSQGDLHLIGVVCICLFLGSFAAVCGAADSTTVADPNLPGNLENDLLLAKNPTTETERQLWKARISASAIPTEDSQRQDDLKALMQTISTIQFKQSEPATEPKAQPASEAGPEAAVQPAAVVEPVTPAEPNVVTTDAPTVTDTAERKLPEGYISEQTLQMFREMLKQPEQLKSPFELAEILYRSDCLKEAAICYQAAFDRLGDDAKDPYEDKAWILFQLGTCLQDDNPEAALENYQRLITDYPHCPWIDAAKAKNKLIDWRLENKPVALIKACQS